MGTLNVISQLRVRALKLTLMAFLVTIIASTALCLTGQSGFADGNTPALTATLKDTIFKNLLAFGRLDRPAPEIKLSNGTLLINFTHEPCLTDPGVTEGQGTPRELITYALAETWTLYPFATKYAYSCPGYPSIPSLRGSLTSDQIQAAAHRGESGQWHIDMSTLAPQLRMLSDGLPASE